MPRVPYKETVTVKTSAEYKHKKTDRRHGEHGHVLLEVEPMPRGGGFQFTERVVGGTVPQNLFPAVQKGIEEGLHEGVLGHFPLVDLRVVLYDGSYHPVDLSTASNIRASQAPQEGRRAGEPGADSKLIWMDVDNTRQYFMGDTPATSIPSVAASKV